MYIYIDMYVCVYINSATQLKTSKAKQLCRFLFSPAFYVSLLVAFVFVITTSLTILTLFVVDCQRVRSFSMPKRQRSRTQIQSCAQTN